MKVNPRFRSAGVASMAIECVAPFDFDGHQAIEHLASFDFGGCAAAACPEPVEGLKDERLFDGSWFEEPRLEEAAVEESWFEDSWF